MWGHWDRCTHERENIPLYQLPVNEGEWKKPRNSFEELPLNHGDVPRLLEKCNIIGITYLPTLTLIWPIIFKFNNRLVQCVTLTAGLDNCQLSTYLSPSTWMIKQKKPILAGSKSTRFLSGQRIYLRKLWDRAEAVNFICFSSYKYVQNGLVNVIRLPFGFSDYSL